MIIDDLWEGAYKGLYGEVVTEDIYRLKQLQFVPDVIFDLGANVGTFSKFARKLFPSSIIIAIEPDEQNIKYFHEFNNPIENDIVLHNMAIGNGEMFRCLGSVNGAHECYISKGLGYKELKENDTIKRVEIRSVMLDFIINAWAKSSKYILKIDIEGNETALFEHEPSMNAIRNAEYIAMELHYHALDSSQLEAVKEFTLDTLDSLKETHYTEYLHPMFYAIKK